MARPSHRAVLRLIVVAIALTPLVSVTASAADTSAAPRRAASELRASAERPETLRARALLAELIREYPLLEGTTVEFGDARGHQAIAYYQSGRIVIDESHSAPLERILEHEAWHVLDWRDNGRLDWGEDVPRR